MKKILVGIPVIYCEECVSDCISSVEQQADDLIIVDNNSTPEIKKIISDKNKIVNPQNVFVNPAWNQIMKYFLSTDNDILIILNSDMVVRDGALDVIRSVNIDEELSIVLPKQVKDFSNPVSYNIETIPGGYPGIMIILTRKMCELVYPIPHEIKLWFGDDWIFKNLINSGYSLRIYSSIECIHGGSRSLFSLPDYSSIIDQDKIKWEEIKNNKKI